MRPGAVFVDVEAAAMLQIFELFLEGQLALAEAAVVEMNGHIDRAHAAALDDQLQQNLVADGIEVPARLEGRAAHRKETAHGVAEAGERHGEQRRHAAVEPAQKSPVIGGRTALDEARADRHVGAALDQGHHLGNLLRRVAEVGVHDHEHVAFGVFEPVEDRPAEAAIGGARHHLHPRQPERLHGFGAAVAAVVIHEQEVQIQPGLFTHATHSLHQQRDVFDLPVGGHHHRYRGARWIQNESLPALCRNL